MNREITTVRRIRFSTRRSASGFSLLEILVVLIILLIGILSILRLFPGGFLTIQRTSERTNASALVEQQLDTQKNLLSVADSVVSAYYDRMGNLIIRTDVTPDDLTDVTTTDLNSLNPPPDPALLEAGPQQYYYSNINKFRYVIGERLRIPVPNSNAAQGNGAAYMLQLGPVYNVFGADASGPTDKIQVYGAPLERTEQSSAITQDRPDNTPVLSGEGQYAIDYARRRIAFPPRLRPVAGSMRPDIRTFVFRYDYYTASGGGLPTVKTVLNGVIKVPDVAPSMSGDPPRPIWQPIFSNDPAITSDPNLVNGTAAPADIDWAVGGLKVNSEDVSRKFKLIATPGNTPTWSDDPYEYAWFSSQVDMAISANVGVLVFNPAGHNALESLSTGTQPLTARIDYATFDNHIIREDRSVPNSAPFDIKLSLPYVQVTGDILPDQTTYNGMFRRAATPTPDVIIYNTNTGEEIPAASVGYTLNGKAGVIRFNQAAIVTAGLQNATLRIFYTADKEWGMQIQKAQASYLQAGTPEELDYRGFYVGGSQSGIGRNTRLYFPISESGKTVILGHYYVQPQMGSYRQFSDEAYQINDNPALNETVGSSRLTWIDLSSQHPEALTDSWQFTTAPTGVAVNNVRGGSFKSRVIWRGASVQTQDGNGNPVTLTRWRKIDNETFLSPTGIR